MKYGVVKIVVYRIVGILVKFKLLLLLMFLQIQIVEPEPTLSKKDGGVLRDNFQLPIQHGRISDTTWPSTFGVPVWSKANLPLRSYWRPSEVNIAFNYW